MQRSKTKELLSVEEKEKIKRKIIGSEKSNKDSK